MVFRDSFDQCPRCGSTLEDAEDARGCRECGGMFVEEPVLAEMLLRMLPPPPRVWGRLVLAESQRGGETLACPQCGDGMKPKILDNVELDHCTKHGVWFDRDELRIALYRVADPKTIPPFAEWEPQPYVAPAPPPPPPKPAPRLDPPPKWDSPAAPTLVFHVREPGQEPRDITLKRDVIRIGKTSTSEIRIADPDTARMHAVIETNPSGGEVIDLGTSSGTFVNDKQYNKHEVFVGDTIRVGSTEIILVSVT